MGRSVDWRQIWEQRAKRIVSDFQLDRGRQPQDRETENLSQRQLIEFIDPRSSETVLDAGCGVGVNILRLHSLVRKVIGIDYSSGSVERCQKKIQELEIKNAEVRTASVTLIPLPNRSVDKILCLSVFQYLDQREVRQALTEFTRVVKPGGLIILHVKNLSSLYWSTLWPAKILINCVKGRGQTEYVRPFRWYVRKLATSGCDILAYDSFNLFTIDVMPGKLAPAVRGFEIRHHNDFFFRSLLARRHGAELMIKAKLRAGASDGRPD